MLLRPRINGERTEEATDDAEDDQGVVVVAEVDSVDMRLRC
jgi:hypothetical protein